MFVVGHNIVIIVVMHEVLDLFRLQRLEWFLSPHDFGNLTFYVNGFPAHSTTPSLQSRGSAFRVSIRYEPPGLPGFNSWQGLGFFSSPPCPDLLWGPPSLLCSGYVGLLSGEVKRPIDIHLVPRLSMHGAKPPLPQNAFMGDTYLSTGTTVLLPFSIRYAGCLLYGYGVVSPSVSSGFLSLYELSSL
jgi:hypothetical protein